MEKNNQEQKELEILRALRKIEYGSIEVTVHGSKIVQIEIREKVRFEKNEIVK